MVVIRKRKYVRPPEKHYHEKMVKDYDEYLIRGYGPPPTEEEPQNVGPGNKSNPPSPTPLLSQQSELPPIYAAAWGWNSNGRAGNITADEVREPRFTQHSAGPRYIACAAGKHHSLLVSDDGSIYSFGDGRKGQLGYGNPFFDKPPKGGVLQVFPKIVNPSGVCKHGRDVKIVEVACGESFSIAREGSLEDGVDLCPGLRSLEQALRQLKEIYPDCPTIQLAWAQARQERFILSTYFEGKLISWGTGKYGELGQGRYRPFTSYPQIIPKLDFVTITKISAGANHVLAVSKDGQLFSWGKGKSGRLGHGNNQNQYFPKTVQYLQLYHVNTCAAGDAHSAVLITRRKPNAKGIYTKAIATFGRGAHGRLGLGHNRSISLPDVIKTSLFPPSFTHPHVSQHALQLQHGTVEERKDDDEEYEIIQLACGGAHTLCLASRKVHKSLANPFGIETYVASWGYGSNGQLGLGAHGLYDHFTPTKVKLPRWEIICEVSAGRSWSLARTLSGELYSWGKGLRGQLGQGNSVDFSVAPRKVNSFASFLSISSQYAHNVAITTTKRILSNGNGNGNGNTSSLNGKGNTSTSSLNGKGNGNTSSLNGKGNTSSLNGKGNGNTSSLNSKGNGRTSSLNVPEKDFLKEIERSESVAGEDPVSFLTVTKKRLHLRLADHNGLAMSAFDCCRRDLPRAWSWIWTQSQGGGGGEGERQRKRAVRVRCVTCQLSDICLLCARFCHRSHELQECYVPPSTPTPAHSAPPSSSASASGKGLGKGQNQQQSVVQRETQGGGGRERKVPFCKCGVFHSQCRLLPSILECVHESDLPPLLPVPVTPLELKKTKPSASGSSKFALKKSSSSFGASSSAKATAAATVAATAAAAAAAKKELLSIAPGDLPRLHTPFVLSAVHSIQTLARSYIGKRQLQRMMRYVRYVRRSACERWWEDTLSAAIWRKFERCSDDYRQEKELEMMRVEDEARRNYDFYHNLQAALIGMDTMLDGVRKLLSQTSLLLPSAEDTLGILEAERGAIEEATGGVVGGARAGAKVAAKGGGGIRGRVTAAATAAATVAAAAEAARGGAIAEEPRSSNSSRGSNRRRKIRTEELMSLAREPSLIFSVHTLRMIERMKHHTQRLPPPIIAKLGRFFPQFDAREGRFYDTDINQFTARFVRTPEKERARREIVERCERIVTEIKEEAARKAKKKAGEGEGTGEGIGLVEGGASGQSAPHPPAPHPPAAHAPAAHAPAAHAPAAHPPAAHAPAAHPPAAHPPAGKPPPRAPPTGKPTSSSSSSSSAAATATTRVPPPAAPPSSSSLSSSQVKSKKSQGRRGVTAAVLVPTTVHEALRQRDSALVKLERRKSIAGPEHLSLRLQQLRFQTKKRSVLQRRNSLPTSRLSLLFGEERPPWSYQSEIQSSLSLFTTRAVCLDEFLSKDYAYVWKHTSLPAKKHKMHLTLQGSWLSPRLPAEMRALVLGQGAPERRHSLGGELERFGQHVSVMLALRTQLLRLREKATKVKIPVRRRSYDWGELQDAEEGLNSLLGFEFEEGRREKAPTKFELRSDGLKMERLLLETNFKTVDINRYLLQPGQGAGEGMGEKEVWLEYWDEGGTAYYVNSATGESVWEAPGGWNVELWSQFQDNVTGQWCWYNNTTGEVAPME